MNKFPIKNYPTIGCCGLDCGLCPRYYTAGSSKCPGCCGPDFFNKHPSCSFITCCVKKKNLEVCAQCDEFSCSKIEKELKAGSKSDSFLTHSKTQENLEFIRKNGSERFLEQQHKRIKILDIMLKNYDDGRSKSFYCLAATLLSITDLETSLKTMEQKFKVDKINSNDFKIKSKILKDILNSFAEKERIELKLRKYMKK